MFVFKYLPSDKFCKNFSLIHLLTCCSPKGESCGRHLENLLKFLFVRKALSLNACETSLTFLGGSAPSMLLHMMDGAPQTSAPGSHTPSIIASFSSSPHLWGSKVAQGLGLVLDSDSDIFWVQTMFILRIISFQMIHTWGQQSIQVLGKFLHRRRRGGHLVRWKTIELWRNLNSLLASTLPFSRLTAQAEMHSASCRCQHDAVGTISWQKWGLEKAWLKIKTDSLRIEGDPTS